MKDCPHPKQPGRDREVHRTNSAVTVVTPDEISMIKDRISLLQKELKEKQVVVVMEETTVNGVAFLDESTLAKFGAAVYSEVTVNGVKVLH